MLINRLLSKHKKLSLTLSIIILILYGLLQIQIVSVVRDICFEQLEGFSLLVVSFANFLSLFSGFISVAFITLITNMCYTIGCCLDVNKTDVFIVASLGHIIYFIFYIFIYSLLNKMKQQHQLGFIIIDNLQQCKEYLNIQLLVKIFKFIYYTFLVFAINFVIEDNTWEASLKYGFLLIVIFVIQIFVLS